MLRGLRLFFVQFPGFKIIMYVKTYQFSKIPGRIEPNFLVVRVYDVIMPFKFGDDRFRGFWLAEGQSLPFPIDFEGRPYNTHTIV